MGWTKYIEGPPGPAGTGLTWKANWANGTSYSINDVVYHQGSSYICIQACSGKEPNDTNDAYWDSVAQKGSDPEEAAFTIVRDINTLPHTATGTVINLGNSYEPFLQFSLPIGAKGEDGDAPNIEIGTTTTLPYTADATVRNAGDDSNVIFQFGIPQGIPGDKGDAASISLGPITTVSYTANASGSNIGTSSAATFVFSIPRGVPGETGAIGAVGINPRGVYDYWDTEYFPRDTVYTNGCLYYCLRGNLSQDVSNTYYWDKLIDETYIAELSSSALSSANAAASSETLAAQYLAECIVNYEGAAIQAQLSSNYASLSSAQATISTNAANQASALYEEILFRAMVFGG